MRVEWPFQIDLLASLVTALEQLKITGNSPPPIITHLSRLLIANPSVGTSPTRVNPQDVLEAEVVPQCLLDHLDGHGYPLPTPVADFGSSTARPYAVIIRQVDIEDQLLAQRAEHGRFPQRLPLTWIC